MSANRSSRRRLLGATALAGALSMFVAGQALAESPPIQFDQPAQPLAQALRSYSAVADQEIMFADALVAGRTAPPLKGAYTPEGALMALLDGTGLTVSRTTSGVLLVQRASDPQSGSAAGDGADAGTVQALIVTAQKREENIQDVPIAMSAFTQEDLTRSQVATGADLMTQVPNMTFTKTNFTSYSIQIRGIGTQAISATVDPAVAVAFNNTPFLRAHFFEQEFFDLERVEVLRGPQGTLYGRNATAGVVNLISAKPKFHFEAKASADVGNYSSTRLEGMLNLPLVEDKIALRLAGAWTKHDGFVTNENTGKQTDGRDLWSTRLSLRIDPTEKLRANFVWEHFSEDDDRLRSGKQLCKTSHAPDAVNGVPLSLADDYGQATSGLGFPARYLSQGCDPASLYAPESFQAPNGEVLPYYLPLGPLGAPVQAGVSHYNVYASATQSRDLRTIESQVAPKYRASSDTVELNLDYDIAPGLTLSSQTGFSKDLIWSSEDYNRFNTLPGAFVYCDPTDNNCPQNRNGELTPLPGLFYSAYAPADLVGKPCDPAQSGFCITAGSFCDPQIGCSDRLLAVDLATARSRQFSQELRVASNFDGSFNFSIGANYLKYKTLEDYYVFINTITMTLSSWQAFSSFGQNGPWIPGVSDNHNCLPHGYDYVVPALPAFIGGTGICGYIDPNPIGSVNGEGHNYFRSANPYKLTSYAFFGEAYYDLTPELKLTAGLRWTVDKKHFTSIPSELLVAGYGYPTLAVIDQQWREPTGRLVLNWRPKLSFTDETMLYASYTHGYKAGGANPPGAKLLRLGGSDVSVPIHPPTFKPEFVDAYELGTKNTLADGRLTSNLTGFYYDYTGYQISEIVDRSAINLNFDAKIWGAELELDWRPVENLRLGLKTGYEDTRVAKGAKAVDLIDRTAGRPGWMVVKPSPTQASNCVLPSYVVAALIEQEATGSAPTNFSDACTTTYLGRDGHLIDPVTGAPYDPGATVGVNGNPLPADYRGFDPSTAPNGGAGFDKNLSGHSLPNAPHWTATLTADYTLPLPQEWLLTLHGDVYYQSEAWTRIFNDPGYDKLKAYNNLNLAAIFTSEDRGWTVMAYIKNVFDKDNITGAFLNSDDTGLTTNVFLNEPRLYGLRVSKAWTDSPWWSAHAHTPGAPYPFLVELDGYHGRAGHDHELFKPTYLSLFPNDLRFPLGIQNSLAALNGGGVAVTYSPASYDWNVRASIRYGRAGGTAKAFKDKRLNDSCLSPAYPKTSKYCSNISDSDGWHAYYETTTSNEEKHVFADFTVGKNLGIGSFNNGPVRSQLRAGLGFARFQSSSTAQMHGAPDFYVPPYKIMKYDNGSIGVPKIHFHRFSDTLEADRRFEGAGPQIDWESTLPFFSAAHANATVGFDVGFGGSVLIGKQETRIRGDLDGRYASGAFAVPNKYPEAQTYKTQVDIARTKSAVVPGGRVSLGLSYSAGGFKVSGGYRIERYFNALDGGYQERKTYDRSFDGPYMKVSIGFGG